ncbi:antibiotic biosynthesis monooxygenase [Mesorhizobium sp. YC-39]|uniref:putative quinol monooxygenase n=1 Tax=unclassified Mesorhizobium TaxID=325217 RepID=UPI0021E777BD|nr:MULTISPECIES: antibiotic biosynthesis monooxygenase [unclassified Mesorhizobium]MCV3207143.1 antibiotic biosynthesis monooxygenase [Mesorhizobium sp. YC-2]MCV3228870.1 antibiotic biosynthesis monooxygenase [Mesorhizobium sp. YC-39]
MTAGREGAQRRGKERLGAAAFAITVAFELLEGAFPEFHRLVTENASLSVALEPDCLRFDVLTPADAAASSHVLLYEIYRDRAAFDLHLASDHFRQFDQRSRDLVISKTVVAYRVEENAKVREAT